MTKPDYTFYKHELNYIRSVNATAPGPTFNHDRECFARYCDMQAKASREAGFPLIGAEIENLRDTAYPTFRSEYPNHSR